MNLIERGQKGGQCTAAQSEKKAAALAALFAGRRGRHVDDPGVSPAELAQLMEAVRELTRTKFERGRVSQLERQLIARLKTANIRFTKAQVRTYLGNRLSSSSWLIDSQNRWRDRAELESNPPTS